MFDREESFRFRWQEGHRPFYEVYFIKGNLLEEKCAFWLRYTLSARKQDGELSQLWGIFFDGRNPASNFAVRSDFPGPPRFSPHGDLAIGDSFLRLDRASGAIESRMPGRRLSWDIGFSSGLPPLTHFPSPLLYRLAVPKTKLASPWWQGRLHGWLEAGGRRFEFSDAPGQLEHLWGTEHAWRWVWGHCNAFDEDPQAVWEGLDAQIKIGPLTSPHLKVFYLQAFGRSYHFNSISRWLYNRSRWKPGGWSWEFAASGQGATLEGRAEVDPAQVVAVTYTDPGGDKLFCHNSKLADLRLTLKQGRVLVGELRTQGAAALEFVERALYPGVVPSL